MTLYIPPMNTALEMAIRNYKLFFRRRGIDVDLHIHPQPRLIDASDLN